MFCRNCGNPIPDGAKFCQTCGAATDLVVDAPVAQNQQMNYAVPNNAPMVAQNQSPQYYNPPQAVPVQIVQPVYENSHLCYFCHTPMQPQTISEQQQRSAFEVILIIILLLIPCAGWFALGIILFGKKSKTKTYMVCPVCGYRYLVQPGGKR